MAHSGFDVLLQQAGVQHFKLLINGSVISTSDDVLPIKYVRDAAPATTNNPRRPDGTRPCSNWLRQGGSMAGVTGFYSRKVVVAPDIYEYLWQGALASPSFVPGHIDYVDDQGELMAIRKALGQYGKADVQLGAALRESKQTAEMVGKYYRHANTLADKMLRAVQGNKHVRQQFRDFLRHGWKDVPSAYLEYLFGMKPLADDITNAVQVLHDTRQHDGSFNMTLKGKWSGSDAKSVPAYSSHVGWVDTIRATVETAQVSRACLYFRLPSWFWDALPPVTFFRESWEVTRLSFVLDWVLPVSDWLAGFEGNQLRPFFSEGTRSTLVRRRVTGSFVDDPGWHPATGGGSDYGYIRTAFVDFPTEELFSLPRFRDTLGLDQLRVGSALLGQKLAKLARAVS